MDTIGLEVRHIVLTVDNVLSVASILCSVLIILGYTFIRVTEKSIDRPSLRLLLESCIFNISFGISQLILNSEYAGGTNFTCNAVMTIFVLSDLASSLLLNCIAINLLLVICFDTKIKISRRALEACYTFGSIGFATFIAITPFFSKYAIYDFSENLHQCWFAYSTPPTRQQIFWELWTFHLWQIIGVITTIVCFSLVLIKLRKEEISIDDNLECAENSASRWMAPEMIEEVRDDEHAEETEARKKETINEAIRRQGTDLSQKITFLKFFLPRKWFRKTERHRAAHAALTQNRHVSYVTRTIRQIICYLAVLIITEIFNFASMMDLIITTSYQPVYYMLGFLSTGARGPLLLLCFLIDPALWSAWDRYSARKQAEQMRKIEGNSVVREAALSTETLTQVRDSDLESNLTY